MICCASSSFSQLVRHLATVTRLVAEGPDALELDAHVAAHAAKVESALVGEAAAAAASPEGRRAVLEALGRAGERYRAAVYARRVAGPERVRVERAALLRLLGRAEAWLRATLWANRRPDGLWHAYNLLRFEGAERLEVERLPLMLEGQVAAIASGALASDVVREVLDALRRSALWRADLGTYLLYPDREVTPFLARGAVPDEALAAIPGLDALLAEEAFGAVLRRGLHRALGQLLRLTVAVAADDGARVEVELAEGATERCDGLTLSADRSRDVFQRNGAVRALRVVFRA